LFFGGFWATVQVVVKVHDGVCRCVEFGVYIGEEFYFAPIVEVFVVIVFVLEVENYGSVWQVYCFDLALFLDFSDGLEFIFSFVPFIVPRLFVDDLSYDVMNF
jgi:hypothetical protein